MTPNDPETTRALARFDFMMRDAPKDGSCVRAAPGPHEEPEFVLETYRIKDGKMEVFGPEGPPDDPNEEPGDSPASAKDRPQVT